MSYNWLEIKQSDISSQGISIKKSSHSSVIDSLKNKYANGNISMVYYMRDGTTITEAYKVTDESGFYITIVDAVNGQVIEL
jgi:hypothetical protein